MVSLFPMNSDLSDHRYSPHTTVFRPYSLAWTLVVLSYSQVNISDSYITILSTINPFWVMLFCFETLSESTLFTPHLPQFGCRKIQVWPKGIVSNGSWQHSISSSEVTDCILFTILQEAIPSSRGVGELLNTDPEASLPPNSTRPPGLPLHHLPLLCCHTRLHQIMLWVDWKRENLMSPRACKKYSILRQTEILLTPRCWSGS